MRLNKHLNAQTKKSGIISIIKIGPIILFNIQKMATKNKNSRLTLVKG